MKKNVNALLHSGKKSPFRARVHPPKKTVVDAPSLFNYIVILTMIIATTDSVPGQTISQTLGLVTGSAVKARHIGSDILAGLRNIVGGEAKGYTKLMNETRELALNRLKESAAEIGADAVVGIRFVSAEVQQGMSELCAYGTAVKLQ